MAGTDWEVLVCGAGVCGAAVARELARAGRGVLLIDRETRAGAGTTSRNSGVVHAGLYHPTGWLKQRTCVEGRRLLYSFCERRDVPHRRCGKLVIARDAGETERLEALHERGRANGVEDLRLLSGEEARRLEPEIAAQAALLSPHSGIVDPHGLTDALIADAEEAGAECVLGVELLGLTDLDPAGALRLRLRDPDGETTEVAVAGLVNAAGLEADRVAARIGYDAAAAGYGQHFAVGHWMRLAPRHHGRVQRLIYPLPARDLSGLGVHLTLELDGALKLGPDLEWVENRAPDLGACPSGLAERFFQAASCYLPGLRGPEELHYDQAGVRPKLTGPGASPRDFALVPDPRHGQVLHMLGIESPGLTAALALAEEVRRRLESAADGPPLC